MVVVLILTLPGHAGGLNWAVKHGDLAALLLDSGATADLASFGYTPLQITVLNNRGDIVGLLLDHKANVNARTGYDIVMLLLAHGAGVDIPNAAGQCRCMMRR